MKSYALWELRTNNMVRDFDNEHDALGLVLEAIELNGPEIAEHLSLTVEDETGEGYLIAYGHELAERARRECAAEHVSG
ncbi:MAG: hypothetical protein M3499_07215 [Actinomycetota bacterium]|jgi:hypothetical protein|nr:hypothetical protein [Actinomycetota bacterium]